MPKISELTTVAAPLSTDTIPLVEAGSTKKATLASLPLSDAEVAALALKAPLASPTFTGVQTLPSVVISAGTIAGITDLAVADGGTGASTAAAARTNLAIGEALQAQSYTAYTTAGTSTAYTITPSPVIAAYAAGQSFFVTFNAACGAAPTLAINGIATPPNLVKQNADGTFSNLAAADIPINHRSQVTLLSATQALVALPDVSLGRGQTWQDVTGSRALSTAYTNSTGRPISVHVRLATTTSTPSGISVVIGAITLTFTDIVTAANGVAGDFIVPNGSTYTVVYTGGVSTLQAWAELR